MQESRSRKLTGFFSFNDWQYKEQIYDAATTRVVKPLAQSKNPLQVNAEGFLIKA
jgi:hypothetical protein